MADEELRLKCQFCSMADFTSVYKIIPHIYFGHRKKVGKQVREGGQVKLRCPAPACTWHHNSLQLERTAPPDLVFSTLSSCFLVLEDHVVTQHTREQRMTVCPYCQTSLADLVYWEHLEEHMGSVSTPKSGTRSTPETGATPSPAKAVGHTTEVVTSPQLKSPPAAAEPPLQPAAGPEPQSVPEPTPTEAGQSNIDYDKPELFPPATESPHQQVAATKVVTVIEMKGQTEEEVSLEMNSNNEVSTSETSFDNTMDIPAIPVTAGQEVTKKSSSGQPRKLRSKRKKDEEKIKRELAEIERKIQERKDLLAKQAQEKNNASISIQVQESVVIEDSLKDKEKDQDTSMNQGLIQDNAIKLDLPEVEEQKSGGHELSEGKSSGEHELSERGTEELARVDSALQQVEITPSPSNIRQETILTDILDVSRKKNFSGEEIVASLAVLSPEPMLAVPPRSREQSGDAAVRRRSASGEKRKTHSVWSREEEGGAEDDTGEAVLESVADPRKRHTSGPRAPPARRSSTETRPVKPVLTEEMERNIIYGNFQRKPERGREVKLNQVKMEIEARFKEEESRKQKHQEEKRKAEQKLREKQRMAEEKARKERERLREERKKSVPAIQPEDEVSTESNLIVEEQENETGEEMTESSMENTPRSSPPPPTAAAPAPTREKSPDQYEKIKMEIRKINSEISAQQRKRPHYTRSPSPAAHSDMDAPAAKLARPTALVANPESVEEEEEEEEDDLEAMMRDFQEREQAGRTVEPASQGGQTSLDLLQSSYSAAPRQASPPAPGPVLLEMGPLLIGCTEEEGQNESFTSAYDLLAHLFLAHRKKVVARARKARLLELVCPVPGCDFKVVARPTSTTPSMDFFHGELPRLLGLLATHLVEVHTGEEPLMRCPNSGVKLDTSTATTWQHLANFRDARRQYCKDCNTFPFRNEEHRCQPTPAEPGRSLEELAKEVEAGALPVKQLPDPPGPGSMCEVFCAGCHTDLPNNEWLTHKQSCVKRAQLDMPAEMKKDELEADRKALMEMFLELARLDAVHKRASVH